MANKKISSVLGARSKRNPTPTKIPKSTPTKTPTATPTRTMSVTPIPTITNTQTLTFGVVAENYTSNGDIPSIEKLLGIPIHTVSVFKQFGLSGNSTFNPSDFQYIKSRGIKIQLSWEPWNPDQGITQSKDYLNEIVTGQQDGYIRSFASAIKSYGGPVVLRFGHEMNGDWYPWGKRPSEYKAAYRYLYNIFSQEGVSNVKWMWCVNISETPDELASYYPGDDVVDTIGIDGFNFGTSQDYGGWREFSDLFGPTYEFLAKTYTKPLVIAEVGSSEEGGNKAEWINNLFNDLKNKYSLIREIIWFDLNKETDWRINSSSSSLAAFKANL